MYRNQRIRYACTLQFHRHTCNLHSRWKVWLAGFQTHTQSRSLDLVPDSNERWNMTRERKRVTASCVTNILGRESRLSWRRFFAPALHCEDCVNFENKRIWKDVAVADAIICAAQSRGNLLKQVARELALDFSCTLRAFSYVVGSYRLKPPVIQNLGYMLILFCCAWERCKAVVVRTVHASDRRIACM